jgi:glutathione peroxidase
MKKSLYEFTASTGSGDEFDFADLRNKPVLIVNTASKCGFTPQYDGLEKLYQDYKEKGLHVIAFPCDQFAHQEPGDDAQIAEFCKLNFGVSFPVMSKVHVNGKDAHPLFVWLKNQAPGKLGKGVKWNFTKFLVAKDGEHVVRFAPNIEPDALRPEIEKVL